MRFGSLLGLLDAGDDGSAPPLVETSHQEGVHQGWVSLVPEVAQVVGRAGRIIGGQVRSMSNLH